MLLHLTYILVTNLLLTTNGFCFAKTQNVKVVIEGIRSSEGKIVIGVYKDELSFKEDNPFIRKMYGKLNMSDGKMKVNLSLEPDTYGLALLDDENDDDVMNFNFLGIPKEGFGFSDYYHTNLSRPRFHKFSFVVEDNRERIVVCRIKYM